MITGYLSVKTLKRVIRVYEQMQDPKYVVGFGSCTINGGLYFDKLQTPLKAWDRYIPVECVLFRGAGLPKGRKRGLKGLWPQFGREKGSKRETPGKRAKGNPEKPGIGAPGPIQGKVIHDSGFPD